MIKILFISDNRKQVQIFDNVFNSYDYSSFSDPSIIIDTVQNNLPDIIIVDQDYSNLKNISKIIKSKSENTIVIFLINSDSMDSEILKYANAFITPDMTKDLILSIVNINIRMKNAIEMLSSSNKDLADSLYRLNALYATSSQFAGTLDKEKLLSYMSDGMDRALSYSLNCTLSLCSEDEPVLILDSLYELSEELISALKLRTVLNCNSICDDVQIDIEKLKVIKNVKNPSSRFTFNLFQYDNMFAPIRLGENLFGFVEIFKDGTFSADDSTCFQTIAQQVALPLKSATLYQEIIEANAKLEKLERMKSEFISIVSHELRTPLTSIKNSLDILSSGKCFDLTDSAEKFLSMAMRNVQRLSGIINDLLDLSKIEAGKMEFKFDITNINSIIDDVKSALSVVAKAKNLNLVTKIDKNLPETIADSQRLEQVLTNLVSNAIKFTPEGKTIKIISKLVNSENININEYFKDKITELSGDYIQVSVEDEGIGIAPEDMLRAFDKFAQIENSLSRKAGGTGLGLPIAKQLLDAHKGAIWCDSEINKGARFTFVIPVVNKKIQ